MVHLHPAYATQAAIAILLAQLLWTAAAFTFF
jgi:hypothetical protein